MRSSPTFAAGSAGDVGYFKGGNGFPVRYQGARGGALPFFKVSDMSNLSNGVFMTQAKNYVSETQRRQIGAARFPAGAIVFAKVGAAVFLERKRILAQDSCIDNNMAGLIVDQNTADVRYIYYQLCNFKMSSLVATTALPSLNGSQLRMVPVFLPPTLEEQQRVAQLLSDADRLIESLERLLAKKQMIKRGMMQQLLTGMARLPGFAQPWVRRAVGDIASVDPDTLGVDTHADEIIEYISLEDVSRGALLSSSRVRFGDAPSRARRGVHKNDVLFGTVRPNLQSHLMYEGDLSRPVASTGFAVVRANPELADPRFIFQLMMSHLAGIQIDRIVTGSNYPAVSSGDVRRLRFDFPDVAEQAAIGDVLTTCDTEIQKLRVRLSKARTIKQGMMQELLTGRTRLPIVEALAA
jgi:type I restriction enzyme S subunit